MPPPPSLMLPPSQPPLLVPAGGQSVPDAPNRVKSSIDGHDQDVGVAVHRGALGRESPILAPGTCRFPHSPRSWRATSTVSGLRLPITEAGLRVAWYRCRTATSARSSLVTPNSCTR